MHPAPQFSVCDCADAAVTILRAGGRFGIHQVPHIVPQPTFLAVPIHIVPHLVTYVPLVANCGPPIVMYPGTH